MNTRHATHAFEPPSTAQELDELTRQIDAGEGSFASLSDEQREQLMSELDEAWMSDFLDDYPVPAELDAAAREYLAIASGEKFPHLRESVRSDLLMQFNDLHGEGGPEHWNSAG